MDSFADDFDEKIDQKSYNDVIQRVKEMDNQSESESDGGILSDELDERSYTPARRNPLKQTDNSFMEGNEYADHNGANWLMNVSNI